MNWHATTSRQVLMDVLQQVDRYRLACYNKTGSVSMLQQKGTSGHATISTYVVAVHSTLAVSGGNDFNVLKENLVNPSVANGYRPEEKTDTHRVMVRAWGEDRHSQGHG